MKKSHKMKRTAFILAVCLICSMPAAAFGAVSDGTVPVHIETVRYDLAAQEILKLVNAERAEAGLQPLTLDSTLQEAAMTRVVESVVYFSHTRPDGTSCVTVNPSRVAGENLAVGQGSPQSAVEAWMQSPGHRANILHRDYRSMGVGCVYYNGVWFWSQTFSKSAGDGKVPEGSAEISQDIELMTGLVEMEYQGAAKIDLAAGESGAELKVKAAGKNAGWGYMLFQLDSSQLSYHSSDPAVLAVDGEGNLTPHSVGQAVITVALNADPDRQISQEVKVVRTLKAEDVKLSRTSYTYNGKAKKPAVTVEGLTENDYVVSYKNNVKVGTATVTVTGVGDADGTVKKTFKIDYDRPDQVVLKTPSTGSSHYAKARWYGEDCDGYQIRYATNSSFKNSKSIYVKDGEQLSRTIKNLTRGKRYYIKVRAYNNYEDTKVFGKWSKWKSIVCK